MWQWRYEHQCLGIDSPPKTRQHPTNTVLVTSQIQPQKCAGSSKVAKASVPKVSGHNHGFAAADVHKLKEQSLLSRPPSWRTMRTVFPSTVVLGCSLLHSIFLIPESRFDQTQRPREALGALTLKSWPKTTTAGRDICGSNLAQKAESNIKE